MNKFLNFRRDAIFCVSTALMLLTLCCFQPAFATPTTPTSDFVDNGDGTVTHKLTGLMWMRCAMGQTWDKATENCLGASSVSLWNGAAALKSNFAGYDDWRLPSIMELQTIVERQNSSPAVNSTLFPNMSKNSFWSSSRYVYLSNYMWIEDLYTGSNYFDKKSNYHAVRLVRGGQWFSGAMPNSDFMDNKNGTVTHKTTQLIWQRCAAGQIWTDSTCSGSANIYTYNQAVALAGTLTDYSDWRIPNETELLSIVNYEAFNPAINLTLFPNTNTTTIAAGFWSSSQLAHDASSVWNVSFYGGRNYYMSIDRSYAVRFVRGQWSANVYIYPYDLLKKAAISLGFGTNYDAKNAQSVELKNSSAQDIIVNNVIVSDAGSYWVNLFVDDKANCRPLSYTQTTKKFTIAANSSCKISLGFSPFDDLNANQSLTATITLKAIINGVASDKVINVTGLGRTQVANAYNANNKLWGQNTWAVAELKGANPPINTRLVGEAIKYSHAKFWYGSVIDAALQKPTASVGNVVVFASNSVSKKGHVGVVIQTSPVVTMLSMNDTKDSNGVAMRRWSVRPIAWYPNKTATWLPLITGFNASDATKHYGFIDWNSTMY